MLPWRKFWKEHERKNPNRKPATRTLQKTLETFPPVNPLHCAILEKDLKKIDQLLREGANVDAQDFNGNAGIHLVFHAHLDAFREYYFRSEELRSIKEMLKKLFSRGANPWLRDNDRMRSIDIAFFLYERSSDQHKVIEILEVIFDYTYTMDNFKNSHYTVEEIHKFFKTWSLSIKQRIISEFYLNPDINRFYSVVDKFLTYLYPSHKSGGNVNWDLWQFYYIGSFLFEFTDSRRVIFSNCHANFRPMLIRALHDDKPTEILCEILTTLRLFPKINPDPEVTISQFIDTYDNQFCDDKDDPQPLRRAITLIEHFIEFPNFRLLNLAEKVLEENFVIYGLKKYEFLRAYLSFSAARSNQNYDEFLQNMMEVEGEKSIEYLNVIEDFMPESLMKKVQIKWPFWRRKCLPLQELCRRQIRQTLVDRRPEMQEAKEFITGINKLPLPGKLLKYLRFLD